MALFCSFENQPSILYKKSTRLSLRGRIGQRKSLLAWRAGIQEKGQFWAEELAWDHRPRRARRESQCADAERREGGAARQRGAAVGGAGTFWRRREGKSGCLDLMVLQGQSQLFVRPDCSFHPQVLGDIPGFLIINLLYLKLIGRVSAHGAKPFIPRPLALPYPSH